MKMRLLCCWMKTAGCRAVDIVKARACLGGHASFRLYAADGYFMEQLMKYKSQFYTCFHLLSSFTPRQGECRKMLWTSGGGALERKAEELWHVQLEEGRPSGAPNSSSAPTPPQGPQGPYWEVGPRGTCGRRTRGNLHKFKQETVRLSIRSLLPTRTTRHWSRA